MFTTRASRLSQDNVDQELYREKYKALVESLKILDQPTILGLGPLRKRTLFGDKETGAAPDEGSRGPDPQLPPDLLLQFFHIR